MTAVPCVVGKRVFTADAIHRRHSADSWAKIGDGEVAQIKKNLGADVCRTDEVTGCPSSPADAGGRVGPNCN